MLARMNDTVRPPIMQDYTLASPNLSPPPRVVARDERTGAARPIQVMNYLSFCSGRVPCSLHLTPALVGSLCFGG